MAEVVKAFEAGHRRGRPSYMKEEWFDGRIWKLVGGKDYHCKTSAVRNTLRVNAWRRNKSGNTQVVDGGKAILFRAVPRNGK